MITVQPKYLSQPQKTSKQALRYDELETRFRPTAGNAGKLCNVEIDDFKSGAKPAKVFVCPECNTTFEIFADHKYGGFRYKFLPNWFPRIGLKKKVCDECTEAKETFKKMAPQDKGVPFKINDNNIQRLVGRDKNLIDQKKNFLRYTECEDA